MRWNVADRDAAYKELVKIVNAYTTKVLEHRCKHCGEVALVPRGADAPQNCYRGVEHGFTAAIRTRCSHCGKENVENLTCWDADSLRELRAMVMEV